MFREIFRRKKEANVLVLIDFENLHQDMEIPPAERFSLEVGFDKIIKKIAQEVGKIVDVFVFAPPHSALLWGETFRKLGFFIIACPKIRTKKGKEIDTTDETLTEFGKKMISQLPNLTHLCLGSGDKDFVPLIREVIRRRLKIIIIAGSESSLATEVINLTDKVYIFSPRVD